MGGYALLLFVKIHEVAVLPGSLASSSWSCSCSKESLKDSILQLLWYRPAGNQESDVGNQERDIHWKNFFTICKIVRIGKDRVPAKALPQCHGHSDAAFSRHYLMPK